MKDQEAEEHIEYVRKVLGIVAVQMTLTFILAAASANFKSIGLFFKNPWVFIFAFILMMGCVLAIFCSKKNRRTVPLNYILLAGATLGEASFLACTAADLTVFSVFTAIMETCLAVAGLFVAALYTASTVDRDAIIRNMIKGLAGALVLNLVMLVVIITMYNPADKTAVFVISMVMCVIAGGYIMFALFFIIVPGLEDKDDYIMGALRLYIEIARLFFWLMQLLGERR